MSNMTPHFFGNFRTTFIFGPDRAVSRAWHVTRVRGKVIHYLRIHRTLQKKSLFHSQLHTNITFDLLLLWTWNLLLCYRHGLPYLGSLPLLTLERKLCYLEQEYKFQNLGLSQRMRGWKLLTMSYKANIPLSLHLVPVVALYLWAKCLQGTFFFLPLSSLKLNHAPSLTKR